MISRRLLRVKVLQILYAYSSFDKVSLNAAEKELFHSLQRTYDLYFYVMLLLIDVVDYARSKIEAARNKRIPTYEDMHPNTRFIDNLILQSIRNHPEFVKYTEQRKLSWVNYPGLIKGLYNELSIQDYFMQYLEKDDSDLENDRQLVSKFLNNIVLEHQPLYHALEEQSIYWTHDLDFVISMITKNIKLFTSDIYNQPSLYPQFKNADDVEFTKKLFRKSVSNRADVRALIEKYVLNWDYDRIAFIDVLIMQMALTEVQEFNSIPVKVSINEYLEIAKSFSTRNSNSFINGILDRAIEDLRKENKIIKTGRGLME